VLERIEDSGPIGAWLLDRAGQITTRLQLSSLTHGRVMHHAIPEDLKAKLGGQPRRDETMDPSASSRRRAQTSQAVPLLTMTHAS
jgi:hypothetical protein